MRPSAFLNSRNFATRTAAESRTLDDGGRMEWENGMRGRGGDKGRKKEQ